MFLFNIKLITTKLLYSINVLFTLENVFSTRIYPMGVKYICYINTIFYLQLFKVVYVHLLSSRCILQETDVIFANNYSLHSSIICKLKLDITCLLLLKIQNNKTFGRVQSVKLKPCN